jgi:zinc transporter 1/2/3
VDGTFQTDENAMAQLIGVAILEFGVILHRHISSIAYHHHPAQLIEPAPSVLIGLTLAVDEKFKVLFVVIIFHRGYYLSIA